MRILNSSYLKLVILALLLRLLIMPFFFHPDIKTYHFQSQFLRHGVFNIYTYLDGQKKNLPLKEEFVYFPLTYFFLGGYQMLISPLLGDNFSTWVSDASGNALDNAESFRYLFLLKFPYLIFDLAAAFLLMRFFQDREKRKKALKFWLFNPFTIVLIYFFSNIDIIVVFLTILSVFMANTRKLVLAAAILGLAAGFKAYPLLFLPFLSLYSQNLRQLVGMIVVCLGVFLAIVAPFYSPSFQNAALISGLTSRIFTSGFGIGFGQTLMITILALAILFFVQLLQREKASVWKDYLSVTLVIFSFVHFHIQWLLWAAPFLVILLIKNKKLVLPVILLSLVAFAIPVLLQDKSMSVSLFSPISNLFNLLPTLYTLVSKLYDPLVVQSVLHSILAGGSLVLIWKIGQNDS